VSLLVKEFLDKFTRPVQHIDTTWKKFLEDNKNKLGLIVGCGGRKYDNLKNVIYSDIVKTRITDLRCDVQNLPFKDETFDWIYASAVLEHIPNIFLASKEMIRVLKPHGKLWCCIPFLQPYHPSPNDYWRVTKEGIRYLFKDLKEIECGSGNGAVSSFMWINMRFIYNLLPRKIDILGRLFVLLFKPLQLVEKKLDDLNLGRKEYDGMRGLAGGYYFIGEKIKN